MEAKIWGPHAWIFLHSITMAYPENPTEQDKSNFRTFFSSIQDILPCSICKTHYKQHLTENPIQLSNRKELVNWLINIHNSVNKLNNKKQYSYNEVINYYDQLYNNSSLKYIIIISVIVISTYLLIKKYIKFIKKLL
mgnify:CR=1 FL=1